MIKHTLNALPKQKVLSLKDKIKLWLTPKAVQPIKKETLTESQSFLNEEKEESEEEQQEREEKESEESDLREIEEEMI